MPACDIYVISLKPRTTLTGFLKSLRDNGISPIVQSRPLRWVILPTSISTVPLLGLNNQWHLFLVLPGSTTFPPLVEAQIQALWTVAAGIPSRLLKDFPAKNDALLNPKTVPKPDFSKRVPKTDSSQALELSPELEKWIASLPERAQKHPISMFNLLAFAEGRKEQYLKYGQAFAESIGSRHGGNAKLVGNVIGGDGKLDGWDEIALAQYPSLEHFAAMLSSSDYQEVNHRYRLGALKDTCILCTMEVDDQGELAGGKGLSRI